MSKAEKNWTARRAAVLEQMRAQRGAQRRASRDSEDHNELLAGYFEPFVRHKENGPAAGTPVTIPELTDFLEKFRKDKKESKLNKAPETPVASATAPAAPTGWQGLLEEADAMNYTQTFGKWLSAIPLDTGICSTPIPELEQLRSEVAFREKALEAILKVTRTELEALESQLNEKKSLAHE